jgi:hypothetical protein
MATANTNILINSISGRIGSVVFYINRGRQCVRSYVAPRNPDTLAQRIVRRAFGEAVRSWQSMSLDEKYNYTRKARHLNMSGYNLFISNYLKRTMRTLTHTQPEEKNVKISSFAWNFELSTWNSIPSHSVSASGLLPDLANAALNFCESSNHGSVFCYPGP